MADQREGVPFRLRKATVDDVRDILRIINELATYEREPEAVVNTEADLTDHLFGEHPAVFCNVAEVDGTVVGIALWFLTYSTWEGRHGIWLEDLYVDEDYRGLGIGKALLTQLCAIAESRGYRRVEWTVLNWNTPSINFYRSLGSVPMDEWTTHRISGPALGRQAEWFNRQFSE